MGRKHTADSTSAGIQCQSVPVSDLLRLCRFSIDEVLPINVPRMTMTAGVVTLTYTQAWHVTDVCAHAHARNMHYLSSPGINYHRENRTSDKKADNTETF